MTTHIPLHVLGPGRTERDVVREAQVAHQSMIRTDPDDDYIWFWRGYHDAARWVLGITDTMPLSLGEMPRRVTDRAFGEQLHTADYMCLTKEYRRYHRRYVMGVARMLRFVDGQLKPFGIKLEQQYRVAS